MRNEKKQSLVPNGGFVLKKFFGRLVKFFREDLSEVVGAYFDGEKIFIAHLTDNFETATVDADSAEIAHIAEKISFVCRQRNWKINAVGFCLRENDAVTYRTEIKNIPAKEIPNFVQTWATAQAGNDAASAFTMIDAEIWMETLPQKKFAEIRDAFQNCGMNLRAMSLMPTDVLEKVEPISKAEFIADVVRQRTSPNFFAGQTEFDFGKISAAMVAVFFMAIIINSAGLYADYRAAVDESDAAKISVENLRDDLALKKDIDADAGELTRLNKIAAAKNPNPTKLNLPLNLGKVTADGIRPVKIRVDEKIFSIEGIANNPAAIKNYLGRVKNSVAKNARLENSDENDDGEIIFTIRTAT